MKQNYTLKTIIVMAVAFFATADNATAQTYQEYACVRDLSVSQQAERNNFDTSQIISKTIDAQDLSQNGNGYRFYTAVIGIDAFPVVNEDELPEVNYWFTSKKERVATVDKAKSGVKKNLDAMASAEPTLKYSSLYRGTIHLMKQLDKDCKKTVYIFTDGAESYVHNFYDVKDWNAEYETIKKALLADMKVPQVKNLEIIFISSGRDEITVQSLRFWSRFFKEHGINTTIKASI